MENAAKLFSVLVVVTALAVAAAAQRAQFDVASVKLHTSDDQRVYMVAQPGGRFVAANITLRFLIRSAFQLQGDQIVGGPNWLDTDRFDIDARAPEAPGPPNAQLLDMLQTQPAQGRGGAGEPPATDPNAISIFTAVQEQLGLRLNSTRDVVDVLAIDTLEHPTPN
jgi:Protein of unknown function (DUF3738)